MQYEYFGEINKPISKIVFGCAIEPMLAGQDATELLDYVASCGINTFDTAENYGKSEEVLGSWLKTKNREEYVILTKGCHPYENDRVTPEDLLRDVYQSLERLQTDYIDIYVLHRDNLQVEVGPIVEVLNELYQKGVIREFGGSNWTPQRLVEANQYAQSRGLKKMMISSPSFTIANQVQDPWGGSAGGVSISGPKNKKIREWYKNNEYALFTYSALARGFFSGKLKSTDSMDTARMIIDQFAMKGYCYQENFERLARVEMKAKEYGCSVSEMAMAWILNQDLSVFPIVSTTRKENISKNLGALNIKLSRKELEWMDLEI